MYRGDIMQLNDVKVIVPNHLLNTMEIQGVTISPTNQELGVLILSEKIEEDQIIIRIYLLKLDKGSKEYHIDYELEAFSFNNLQASQEFVERLPSMSALEMLILLNSTP